MRRVVLLLASLGRAVTDRRSWGQNPVSVAGAAAQRVLQLGQMIATAANTAASYVRQGEQIVNEYNIIRNQIVQIEHEVANLQRIPKGLNFLDDISLFSNRLTGLMAQANAVSFELDQATKDFEKLYQQAATVTRTGDVLALRRQLLDARMQASGMSVQMTAVRTHLSDVFTRLCALLNGSWTASGNLDSQQIAAQQQGLLLHSQQMAQAMLATQARLQAQREAEEVVLEQVRLQVLQDAVAPVAPYTDARGTLPVYRWMDQ
jgi:P-type conjugative transfer protein TrbJ